MTLRDWETGLMGVFTVVKEENLLGIGVEFLEEFEISFIALLTSLTWMFKALTSSLSFLTYFSSSDMVSELLVLCRKEHASLNLHNSEITKYLQSLGCLF